VLSGVDDAIMINGVEFGEGVICKFDDFDLQTDIPLIEQVDLLKEDLLQVTYDNNYLIDVGWYPEFDPQGMFGVSVIKDNDWSDPVIKKKCKDLNLLFKYLKEAIGFVSAKRISEADK
jgi:hypothetical protein